MAYGLDTFNKQMTCKFIYETEKTTFQFPINNFSFDEIFIYVIMVFMKSVKKFGQDIPI